MEKPMRYVLLALALGLAACTNQASIEAHHAAVYLDGKVVKDIEGCAYTVTQYSDTQSSVVMLRLVAELSAETCTATQHDAS